MKKLFSICFATLLVLAMTCTKAHFAPGPDGSVADGATAGIGGTAGAGGTLGTGGIETGGMGGASCQLSAQDCSKPAGEILTDPMRSGLPEGHLSLWPEVHLCGHRPPTCLRRARERSSESESCTVKNSGGSDQSDDCAAGNICLAPVSELDRLLL
jgi:hypothetical protein